MKLISKLKVNLLKKYEFVDYTNYRLVDGFTNKNRDVWVISHGLSSNWESMKHISSAIKAQKPNDIIFLLDWSNCAQSSGLPGNVDECIRPIAKSVVKTLNEWGMDNNGGKLRLAGHSLGTFMVTEISNEMSGTEKSLYLLDPPSTLATLGTFTVDNYDTSNRVYGAGNGYDTHTTANQMIAFTGIKKNGDPNWCGNGSLNRTADQSVFIYIPDIDDGNHPGPSWLGGGGTCPIHSHTHESWAKLISSQQINIDGGFRLGINGSGVGIYPRTKYYDNQEIQATLQVHQSDNLQTVIVEKNGELHMYPRGGDAWFRNFDEGHDAEYRTVRVKNFDDQGSRILLEGGSENIYSISGNSIIREYSNQTNSQHTSMIIEGGRSGDINTQALNDAYSSDSQIRNNSPIKLR
ncbi:MAG: hypothetical protein HC932_02960 [Thermales bacterium]|nr:hypothetical protein [Thermales bacterium]